MQRLYNERQFMQKKLDDYDDYFALMKTPDHKRYRKAFRSCYTSKDQLPEMVLAAKNNKELANKNNC